MEAAQRLGRDMNDINKPLDLALAAIRGVRGWQGYWIEPNLVQHIGFVSSLGDELLHTGERDAGDLREYQADYAI